MHELPKRAAWFDETREPLFRLLFWGTVIAFGVMVVAAWLQVISRYFFNYPLGWTGELAQIMMFWFTFLAVGTLVRKRRLMKVDAFIIQFPRRAQLFISAVVNLASAVFLSWLWYLSLRLMELASRQISTALHIPYKYIYLSLAVGLAGAVVYFVAIAIADLRLACRANLDSVPDPTRQPEDR